MNKTLTNKDIFMTDRIVKLLFKSKTVGKMLTARMISLILHTDYQIVYDNLKLVSEDISFDTRTVNSEADIILSDDSLFVNVEVNYFNGPYRNAQMNSYIYQLYLRQIVDSKSYVKIKKVIQIILETRDYFEQNSFVYNVVYMEKKLHIVEDDKIEKFRINLAYLKKLTYNDIINEKDELKKMLYFLVFNDYKKLKELYQGDDLMTKVIKEAKRIAGLENMPLYYPLTDEEVRELDKEYYREQGMKEGIQEGIKEGIQEGIKEGIQKGIKEGIQKGIKYNLENVILNMVQNNLSLDIIAKYVNLDVKEVKDIITNSKKS